jgi:hypothetical protein
MPRFPDKARIAAIAEERLRSEGHGDPKLRRIQLVTLDPQRREMLAFIKGQRLSRDERKRVLTLYRSRPRQEWSVDFWSRVYQGTEGKWLASVTLDVKGNVNKVWIFGRGTE